MGFGREYDELLANVPRDDQGMPKVRMYHIKPYAFVESLDELRGPSSGEVTLPHSVFWAPGSKTLRTTSRLLLQRSRSHPAPSRTPQRPLERKRQRKGRRWLAATNRHRGNPATASARKAPPASHARRAEPSPAIRGA